jgi:hypothetical protein
VSAWRRFAEAALGGVLGAALVASVAAAQQEPAAQEVASLFERGRYDLALSETRFIESPQLRAEWRFHVLYNAGNLPAALDEAIAGLDAAPQSLDLARNAVLCALTLGLGGVAEHLLERWGAAIDSSPLDDSTRESWRKTHAEQSAFAAQVRARERSAAEAAQRARWICIAGFGAAFGAVILLSRTRSAGRASGADEVRPT